MDTTELISAGFWQSERCHVMANPRDADAVAEAGLIKLWADQQPGLSGHLLFATSGSAGGRKWVALSREALLTSAGMVNRHLSSDAHDRWLMALPDFHVGGMGILARCYDAGCEVVRLGGKWDPEHYHGTADSEGVTLSSMVPTQMYDLVQCELRAPESLRAVLIGGGRLDDDIYQRAVALGWPVMETYGMTEAGSQVATATPGSRDLHILPGWQVKVTDHGRLSIKGDALLTGYVSCCGDTFQLADPVVDGWFDTGDLVELDGDKITVKGRADRCVKVLGELVNLSEVETGVSKMAADMMLANPNWVVVAVPDRRKGSRMVLCGERSADVDGDVDQIRNEYNRGCHPVERIDDVYMLEKIPRSPLGKVLYGVLAEEVAGQMAAEE